MDCHQALPIAASRLHVPSFRTGYNSIADKPRLNLIFCDMTRPLRTTKKMKPLIYIFAWYRPYSPFILRPYHILWSHSCTLLCIVRRWMSNEKSSKYWSISMAKPEAQFWQSIQQVMTPMTENPLQVQTVGIGRACSFMSIYLISDCPNPNCWNITQTHPGTRQTLARFTQVPSVLSWCLGSLPCRMQFAWYVNLILILALPLDKSQCNRHFLPLHGALDSCIVICSQASWASPGKLRIQNSQSLSSKHPLKIAKLKVALLRFWPLWEQEVSQEQFPRAFTHRGEYTARPSKYRIFLRFTLIVLQMWGR